MQPFLKRTWADIDLDALVQNYHTLNATLSAGCRFMAVVKADGYGHGAVPVARELEAAGCGWFAVSNIEEAQQLRTAGVQGRILILGPTPPEYAADLAGCALTQTVPSREYAERLNAAAQAAGVRVTVHIKLDTGMSRIGFLVHEDVDGELDDVLAACRLPALDAEGAFTHFASADEADDGGFTRLQYERFTAALDRLAARGVTFAIRHCCNSAATVRFPEYHMDMVRVGVSLYGLAPDGWMESLLPLCPVMRLNAAVSQVKRLPAGDPVSYGRTFVPDHDLTVATVPIGYADGYPRALSNRGRMLVGGSPVPLLGRVCMDQSLLDVSGLAVAAGDTVTVFGTSSDGTLPVGEVAAAAGTVHYELICQIGKRVTRVYVRNGAIVQVTALPY